MGPDSSPCLAVAHADGFVTLRRLSSDGLEKVHDLLLHGQNLVSLAFTSHEAEEEPYLSVFTQDGEV